MNSSFDKCPYCGAWRRVEELENHVGVCYSYRNHDKSKAAGDKLMYARSPGRLGAIKMR